MQEAKARAPMSVTELEMTTLVRPLQDENAPSAMLVTCSGIVIVLMLEQDLKAHSPISLR